MFCGSMMFGYIFANSIKYSGFFCAIFGSKTLIKLQYFKLVNTWKIVLMRLLKTILCFWRNLFFFRSYLSLLNILNFLKSLYSAKRFPHLQSLATLSFVKFYYFSKSKTKFTWIKIKFLCKLSQSMNFHTKKFC